MGCGYNVIIPTSDLIVQIIMNIFVTDPSPYKSAVVLPDKHIVKMPLETCQTEGTHSDSIVCSDKWGHGFGTLLIKN